VFKNKVLRKIFGSKKDEVTGQCRRLHIKEFFDLYSSPNIIQVIKSGRMSCVGHTQCVGERRGVYRVLLGKPEGKRLLARPRLRWEGNIKMILKKWDGRGHGLD
jgi:hypothetical protein